jgi:hypothetical protein
MLIEMLHSILLTGLHFQSMSNREHTQNSSYRRRERNDDKRSSKEVTGLWVLVVHYIIYT